jgi:hypothetical protein
MALFDGLYFYEIALLVLGALLFLVLLPVLLRLALSNKKYQHLIPFFLISAGMMGFPAFTKIQIDKGKIEIDKTTHDLQSNPQSQQARADVETSLTKIAGRPIHDPATLATVAKAQFALGHDTEAESNLSQALAADPTLQPAVELKHKIELTQKLTQLTKAGEATSPQAREELKKAYTALSNEKVANPKAIDALSKAKVMLEVKPGHP